MTHSLRELKEEKLRRLYQRNPAAYAADILKQEWTPKQTEIADALIEHHRVSVRASHSIGKTHLGGGLVNWFFDCFVPGICITTAPTQDQVDDLLWKEVRMQREGRPGLLPKASRLETSPEHFAVGYTARTATGFQGRHDARIFILFDEAIGVEEEFWTAAEGMLTGDEENYWLTIFNPTDTTSHAYDEELSGGFHVIRASAMEHPNIDAELRGEEPPFPNAVRLAWLDKRVERWCEEVPAGDKVNTDFEWRPGSGRWYRPGPLFEGRVLGRWPSQATTSVWSEGLWDACMLQQPVPNKAAEIGCDVARFGDDFSSFVTRRGPCALQHETHNGWRNPQVARKCMELAQASVREGEDPKTIRIKVDDDGVGGGVVDILVAEGFNVIAVNAQSIPMEPEDYPNIRSELWFHSAEDARKGLIDVSRLSKHSKDLLRRQLMSPKWKLDAKGKRVVEPKDETKKRLTRSPDDADAFNLAFAPLYGGNIRVASSKIAKRVNENRVW